MVIQFAIQKVIICYGLARVEEEMGTNAKLTNQMFVPMAVTSNSTDGPDSLNATYISVVRTRKCYVQLISVLFRYRIVYRMLAKPVYCSANINFCIVSFCFYFFYGYYVRYLCICCWFRAKKGGDKLTLNLTEQKPVVTVNLEPLIEKEKAEEKATKTIEISHTTQEELADEEVDSVQEVEVEREREVEKDKKVSNFGSAVFFFIYSLFAFYKLERSLFC